jgi:hypothetical protein
MSDPMSESTCESMCESESVSRSDAIMGFLGAGMYSTPTPAAAVEALARVRSTVALLKERPDALSRWLLDEIKMRGIRENAAVLACVEMREPPLDLEGPYRQRYPDRQEQLDRLVHVIRG